MSAANSCRWSYLRYALLVLGLIALAFELALLLPTALDRWRPWDYGNYLLMGRAVREGVNPYGLHRCYPLPTIIWIFVPLSLAPDWFRLIWILCPFISVLILFRARGLWLYRFPPLWFLVTDAMFDAWLLLPLVWLFENRRWLAPFGAAFLLFKPHVTFLAVLFTVARWLWERDWHALAIFSGIFSAFWIPSLVLDPHWPAKMLQVLPERVEYLSILPLSTTAITSWLALGGFSIVTFLMLLIAVGVLFVCMLRDASTKAQGFQLLQLLILPTILASNLIMALPMLRERKEIITIVLIGLVAYALDRSLGGFGGGYSFTPLAAMYFLINRSRHRAHI